MRSAILVLILLATCPASADECSDLTSPNPSPILMRCMALVPVSAPRVDFIACLNKAKATIETRCKRVLPQLSLKWDINGYDLRYSVTNHGKIPIKDAIVYCERIGGSGTVIAESRQYGTVYKTAHRGETIDALLPAFFFGWDQQSAVNCAIIAAKAAN